MEFRTLDPRWKSLHEQHELWEQVDALQGTVAFLSQRQEHQATQWRVVCEEQRQHCADLASIYQQLQGLLLTGVHGEARQRSGSVGVAPQEPLRREVSDLLQNFKQRIERHVTETNQRLDNMQRSLEDIQQKMKNDNCGVARQEERLTQLEEQQKEMLQRMSFTTTQDDLERLRTTVTQQLHSQQADVTAVTQRCTRSVDERFTTQETHYREEHGRIQREMRQSIEEVVHRLQGQLDNLCGELKTHASAVDVITSNLEEQTRGEVHEILTAHAAKTCEQVQDVHRELTGKHLQLVADTMNALGKMANLADELPLKVFLLQEDVVKIRDTLHSQGELLNEQCLQGSLQGAFDEVKDWLQDLERRLLGRGEFDETMAGIDKKLAALKREFISRGLAGHTTDQGIDDKGISPVAAAATTTRSGGAD
ncbi:hypothetical protein TraAM80_07222 [Trypanosoma rangeli]|uniref:Uncharacterized protein n=1 Tax=Trypanosoma rangeli TaxID=5698 RepID=A0A422N6H3_TRYRA|nr:uncharacterized protein TraAM80_07222 [Trypanosoma rangeli]RNF01060.1 hypothetical protein TraAM80_07222 [Trypanosoma rangeli]|eukprot:RNF01060.1 hypothetical protein TraAM80_07222 [Trypanosoma rangeli]